MPEVSSEGGMKKVKLCWKCKMTLKEVMGSFNILEPAIHYCQNIMCERYGLVAAVWTLVVTDDKGLSIESTVSSGIEIR